MAICRGCGITYQPHHYKQVFCETCRSHPLFSAYRQAEHKFNISFTEWEALYDIQYCECCGTKLRAGGGPGIGHTNQRQIDHCHETGRIRGVLCWDCNSAIGKLGDDTEGIINALNYLKGKHK